MSNDNSKSRVISFLPFLVAALAVVPFLPVLRNGFVDWDDNIVILYNPNYRGLGWAQLGWMFTNLMSLYRPLTWMTLGTDYLVWGLNPAGYHLTSLIFHAANAVLVYFVALRLLSVAMPAERNAARLAAAVAALIFAVHPLRVEPVAWASGRENVVAAFFLFLALLFYLRSVEAAGRRAWMIAAWLFYGLSLLAKASGVTFPLVLLALDVLPLHRLPAKEKWFNAGAARVWLEKIPFFILSIAAAALSVIAKREAGALADSDILANLPQALYGVGVYIWKALAPINLSPIYPVPAPGALWRWPLILFPMITVAVTIAVVVLRRRRPFAATAWLCYLALLLPSSGIVKYGPQLVADRYTYLPDVVWAVCAGAALLYVWRRRPRTILPLSALAAAILFVLGFLTWKQTQVWHDSESLFRRAVAVAPRSVIAHHNLAGGLANEGRIDEAVELYRGALAIQPYADGHAELGRIFALQGKVDEAIAHDREAIRLDPAYLPARQNLALLFIRLGRLDEAEKEYRAALTVDPSFVEGHHNLAYVLASRGRLDEAIAEYREALKLKPDFAAGYANLGDALLRQGKTGEAIANFKRALEIDPNFAPARQSLEKALAARR
jgi:tetratricopeptide (TPR) repeat protein